ncbi:MAG: DUF6776 family protein [Pseudomonadales bacterium]
MADISSSDLRVVVHQPGRRLLLQLLVAAAVLAALAGGFYLGRAVSGLDQQYLSSLESINSASGERIAILNRDLIDARLAYDVDSQALNALRIDLQESRTEMARLSEEVTFYRSLMAPNAVAKGLQIARFETQPLASGTRSYHLLLTQIASRRTWLSGKARVEISGRTATGERVLPLTDFTSLDEYPLRFRFRYFQDLRGELRMPDGFTPSQVTVTVERSGKKPLTRTFPWPAGA